MSDAAQEQTLIVFAAGNELVVNSPLESVDKALATAIEEGNPAFLAFDSDDGPVRVVPSHVAFFQRATKRSRRVYAG